MIPLVVEVEDLEARSTAQYAFHKSPVRLGRGELNDLRLDRPFVSTWHGVVQFEGDAVVFVDLGSTNGTWLDGARLAKNAPAAIGTGADLRIGTLRLTFARRAAEARAAAPRPATQFSAAVAALEPAPSARREAPDGAAGPATAMAVDEGPARAAVEAAAWQLGVLHEACTQAQQNFDLAVAQAVAGLAEAHRARALALVAERFPGGPAGAKGSAAAPPPSDDAARLLRAFAGAYLADGAPPPSGAALERFLQGASEVLEAFARSYLELRRGYDQFGREMGIRVARGEGALSRSADAREVLAYLLQPGEDEPRAKALSSAFADLMIHQVALLNGVTAGARELLDRLSPDAIAAELDAEGGSRLPVKALRDGAQWRAFVAKHRELADDEGARSDALFGKAFARAYSEVAGARGGDDAGPPTPGPKGRR